MKKFLKIIAWFLFFTVAAILATMAYWNRDQALDFSAMLPNELQHCDSIINRDSAKYIELKNWFNSNQQGWNNTPATYVPMVIYNSDTMSVNVMDSGVVVNYKQGNSNWNQVTRQKKTNELVSKCTKTNKSLNLTGAKDAPPS